MPVTAPRASKAAVEEVYADLELRRRVVTTTAMWFVKRHRTDADETIARANLHFLEAYHTFDPHAGTTLEQRVVYTIRMRLFDWVRACAADAGRTERLRRGIGQAVASLAADGDGDALDVKFGRRLAWDNWENVPGRPDATPSPTDPVLADLSPDAREAVRLTVFVAAPERSPRRVGPADARAAVRKQLRGRGWTKGRVRRAFDEIRAALTGTTDN